MLALHLFRAARNAALAVGLAAAVQVASAQPTNMTHGEVALTHPVCQDAQGMPSGWQQHFRHSPRAPYWESVMGKTFWAVHHYCWALIHLQRAARGGISKQDRDHMIRVAISDFYYVIKEAKNNNEDQFVLLPELYYRAGEAYVQLQDYAAAMAEFERSRQAKADYWPAYVTQAQVHMKLGMRAQARELLDAGLKLMPDEPNLREAHKKLEAAGQDARRPRVAPAAASARTTAASQAASAPR
jgi:tetratricopeptide (TPR) repeat protein